MKPLVLSEEFIVDSSDDEEPAVEERRTTPKTASNSLPDRSSVTCTKLKKQKTANPQEESSPESEPNGEDDHIDSDNDEEDNGDPPSAVELLDNSAAQATAKQSPRNRVKPRQSVPAKPYTPPSGFKNTPTTFSGPTSLSDISFNHGLAGKQIWHITAPADVHLNTIKSFGIESVMKGEPIQNSEGTQYSFTQGPTANKCLIVVDSKDRYVSSKSCVHRTYHLREVIDAATKSKVRMNTEDQAPEIHFEFQGEKISPRPIRQQPKGLRMRYKPFGTASASPEPPNEEAKPEATRMEFDVPANIMTPPPEEIQKRTKKRKERHLSVAGAKDDSLDTEMPQLGASRQVPPSQVSKQLDHALTGNRSDGISRTAEGQSKLKSKKHKAEERLSV